MDESPYRRRCDRRVSATITELGGESSHANGGELWEWEKTTIWDTETEIEDAADRMTVNTYA